MAKNPKPKKEKIVTKFEISDELRDLAKEICVKERLDFSPAKVEYMLVYPYISKTVAGKCIRCNKELKYFSDNDYLIQISGDLWDTLSPENQYLLLFHELLHIFVYNDEKTGDWKFSLRSHDIEDFSRIVSKHGVDWINNLKLFVSSVHKLNDDSNSSITF